MTKLETIEQLEDFLGENPEAVILKHSSACPISARAYGEFSLLCLWPQSSSLRRGRFPIT